MENFTQLTMPAPREGGVTCQLSPQDNSGKVPRGQGMESTNELLSPSDPVIGSDRQGGEVGVLSTKEKRG